MMIVNTTLSGLKGAMKRTVQHLVIMVQSANTRIAGLHIQPTGCTTNHKKKQAAVMMVVNKTLSGLKGVVKSTAQHIVLVVQSAPARIAGLHILPTLGGTTNHKKEANGKPNGYQVVINFRGRSMLITHM